MDSFFSSSSLLIICAAAITIAGTLLFLIYKKVIRSYPQNKMSHSLEHHSQLDALEIESPPFSPITIFAINSYFMVFCSYFILDSSSPYSFLFSICAAMAISDRILFPIYSKVIRSHPQSEMTDLYLTVALITIKVTLLFLIYKTVTRFGLPASYLVAAMTIWGTLLFLKYKTIIRSILQSMITASSLPRNLEHHTQSDALANKSQCFGPGNRSTIKPQDHRLLEEQGSQLHTVYIYCEDTLQYSFASHLSMDFRRKGIYAFVNDNETDLDVIESVSASVVVFSKSCVSSTSRLDKLVRGQLVVPVYYDISPSDLVVVQEHESADRIKELTSALKELIELAGHHKREQCSDRELVEVIVEDVHDKLFPTEQIGIKSRLLEMENLLCKQPWGVRRIGVWGMPGIGKTTLAKAFFDKLCGGYEASCFIKHFDKAFHQKGLHRLSEEHFGKVLKEMPRVCSSITRPSLPGDKLSKKRTLVVLDDVHNPLVAECFLRGIHWFGPGSLIIITSRDKEVFRLCQINHVYEVQSLNEAEALQLFYQCACVKDMREQNFLKLSMEVVDYASGNPFALRFYGGELKGKKLSEMETTFLKLTLRMPYKIHDLFKTSYETLNDSEKNIFLDIACFFEGENVDYVMQLLEGCSFFPHVGIDVLVEKCLVTISENKVKMHRIIQDFGREIINGETVQIERRRRLWEPWTIKFLLEDGKLNESGDPKATYARALLGTENIEGIFLNTSNLIFDVKPGAFENMLSLRFLKIYCSSYEKHDGLHLPKGLESLPYELRLLHWENYPLQFLPQDFDPCHLVELNLSYSQLRKLWGGTKNLKMLKMVRLCHSEQLTEINDLCKAQNIELIDLEGCTKLQIFPAMGQLQHLRVVNLSGCAKIRSFPEVSPTIEELHLQGTGIRELPISTVTLNLERSNLITEFPGVSDALNHEQISSQHLRKLVCLNMKDCVHLRSLPHMADLESLMVLNLSGCSELDDIQGFPRNLKELYLAGTAIKEIPMLPLSVELLDAHGCVSLISIPIGMEKLPKYYTFSNCFALSAQVVNFFVKNALTNVERIARKYQQEQKFIKSLAFSFTVPSPAKFEFDMQSGSSVMIQLGSWRSTLGFAILVEVAFSDDYHEASGFDVICVCRWKDKECVSHRLAKNFHCWTQGEGVPKDHMFVFCDFIMHPSSCEGNDPSILADLVVFEFFTVNKEHKLLDESCTVKKCGVYVITVANEDTSSDMTHLFSSSDYLQEIFDNEVEQVWRVIYDGLDEDDRNLFSYIACLFNDEETNLLASLVARIGLGISSRLKVLANKSLIHISPCGIIIVRHGLLQKICRENLPHSFKMHSSMCIELKNLVDRIMIIVPHIEDALSGCSSDRQALCLLYKALDKAKLLLQYCKESSKLYLAVTGDAILTRGSKATKSLGQYLKNIQNMVPTVLSIKICQIVRDLRSTVLTLESSEEEAGKAIRELMRTSSSVSSDEIRDFHSAALKLQLSTPEVIVIERRSLKCRLAKLGEVEVNKRQLLKYLLYLLEKHERIICAEHIDNSFSLNQSANDPVCASAVEARYSEEDHADIPENFKCPLSLTLMYDPVVISSGHTFERVQIQRWFDEGNVSCPISERKLDQFSWVPNLTIKAQISEWCAKHNFYVQDPAMSHAKAWHEIDSSVSTASFSCFSDTDTDTDNSSYDYD